MPRTVRRTRGAASGLVAVGGALVLCAALPLAQQGCGLRARASAPLVFPEWVCAGPLEGEAAALGPPQWGRRRSPEGEELLDLFLTRDYGARWRFLASHSEVQTALAQWVGGSEVVTTKGGHPPTWVWIGVPSGEIVKSAPGPGPYLWSVSPSGRKAAAVSTTVRIRDLRDGTQRDFPPPALGGRVELIHTCPTWHPNEDLVALVVGFRPGGPRAGLGVADGDVYLLRLGDGTWHRLTNGVHAVRVLWSPDGSLLAYATYAGSLDRRKNWFDISFVSTDGRPALMGTWADERAWFSWLPSGDRLLVCREGKIAQLRWDGATWVKETWGPPRQRR